VADRRIRKGEEGNVCETSNKPGRKEEGEMSGVSARDGYKVRTVRLATDMVLGEGLKGLNKGR